MRIEKVFCDICGKELEHPAVPNSKLPRFFHAEIETPCEIHITGEGKAVTPTLATKYVEKYDFCQECVVALADSIQMRKADRFKPKV